MTEQADRWMEQIQSDSLSQLEAIREMQTELAEVHGESEALQGRVRVRVTPAGMPVDLQLDPDVTRLEADEISRGIMTAVAEATAQAAERMRAIVGGLVPEEQLDAMMSGQVSESERRDVREQIELLRGGGA